MNAADRDGMTDEELAIELGTLNRQSVGYLTDEVSADQDDNLDRYLGRPYGDEEDGTSNAVSMDVAEVVDWALPDLLEPFLAGERVVEFEPSTEADIAYCEQASDLANYCFFNENPGVTVLHDTIKTALIQKIGIVKTWWESEEVDEEQSLEGLTQQAYEEMQSEDGVEILEASAEAVDASGIPPDALAAYTDGQSYSVKVRRTKKVGRQCVESVPPEEFRVSQRSKSLQDVEYVCHERDVTRAQLIGMGFDEEIVMSLPANKNTDQETRKDRRFSDEQRIETGSRANLSDWVTLFEEYPLIDVEGSGRPRRWKVFRVEKRLLEKEPVDDHPFDAWSADRIPHRLIGLGLADKVKQTQYIKTHLTRQMLDNVYLANNPRFEVPDAATGEQTIDDLLTYRVGGLIRTKGIGGGVRPIEVPDRSATAMQAIIYMDSVREQQSGIVRNGMAVSSEVVDPKSATEARKEDRSEQSRKKLMIRMIAETLLVPIFRKILKGLVKHQDAAKSIYLNGKFVTMDPRSWNSDMRATAAVGLGYANREEMLQGAMVIGQAQQLMIEAVLNSPPQIAAKLYETGKQLVKAVGWKFPEKYFLDPQSQEAQQLAQQQSQQQDPKMVEAQGKLQLKQAELQQTSQMRMLEAQRDVQLEMLKAEAKRAVEERNATFDMRARMAEIQLEYDLGLRQLEAEIQLKQQQFAFEAGLEERRLEIEARQADRAIEHKANNDRQKLRSVRFGGKVG